MRKIKFAENEFYHVYNRGTEKRKIFLDKSDFNRFLKSMKEFNCMEPIGSLYEKYLREKKNGGSTSIMEVEPPKLVELICFSLLHNHFHLILKQISEKGIEKFMQRLGTGYTMYFNKKYARTGGLFQGKFKSSHIKSTEQLLYLSVYVNCNAEVHNIAKAENYQWSSFEDFTGIGKSAVCDGLMIMDNFKDGEDYKNYSKENIVAMKQKKEDEKLILE